jgi:hypothetical protein
MTLEHILFLPKQGEIEVPLLTTAGNPVLQALHTALMQRRVVRNPLRCGVHTIPPPLNCTGSACIVDVGPEGTGFVYMAGGDQGTYMPMEEVIVPLGHVESGSTRLFGIIHCPEESGLPLQEVPIMKTWNVPHA